MLTHEAVFQKIKIMNQITKRFCRFFLFFILWLKGQAGVVQLARM